MSELQEFRLQTALSEDRQLHCPPCRAKTRACPDEPVKSLAARKTAGRDYAQRARLFGKRLRRKLAQIDSVVNQVRFRPRGWRKPGEESLHCSAIAEGREGERLEDFFEM